MPDEAVVQTKPVLARVMLARAFAAGVPAAWVTGDAVYGRARRLRRWLAEQERPFVLAIPTNAPWWVQTAQGSPQLAAATIAAALTPDAWVRLSAGEGSTGPRGYDWAWVRLARWPVPGWAHWLVVRRSLADPTDVAYSVVFGPADTPLATLVRVAGTRWAVEESFAIAKGAVGLDHDEVRRWEGWYRHSTLALLAQAFLTVVRARVAGVGKGGVQSCWRRT